MLSTFQLNGLKTDFTFNWPYLDRTHIMVTVDLAARPFKFIDAHTISVKSLFGEPLPSGVLKIFRVTPDLDAFAEFKDAANLTSTDLNRARLQCLFLIQERSGGLGGSVGQAVQLLVNEIETISGALNSIAFSQGVLTAGLQTLNALDTKILATGNEGAALRALINQTIADSVGTSAVLNTRLETVESKQSNLLASVTDSVNTLVSANAAQASRVSTLEAQATEPEFDADVLSAALITSAIASVKDGVAQGKRIDSLEVKVGTDIAALIQQEQTVRASADVALANQITTLQATTSAGIAQVTQDINTQSSKVSGLSAQYALKAVVQRADGKPIMAGIALAATANNDMSGSEIVMMADKLVFASPSSVNGPLKPLFIAGDVDGSPTFIVPANNMGDRSYPGRVLVDGSIEARSVAANTITGDKLVAGAITTREINVGLGANLLANASFVQGLDAWTFEDIIGQTTYGVDLSADWKPAGGMSAPWIRQAGGNYTGLSIDERYTQFQSAKVQAIAGERYEFSSYTGAHRCNVQTYILFFGTSNNFLGSARSETGNNQEAQGGPLLSSWKRIGGFATAPAGTATATTIVRKGATFPGQGDSYLFFCLPSISVAMPNQTRLSPWTPSGLGTKITPQGISTPSLSALSATIGLLRTATSGARMELSNNVLKVFDANGVLRVQLGDLSA